MTDTLPPEEFTSPAPQVVPQSREAEEALIGAVLINPEAYYDVAPFLKADDFYIIRHRWIWDTFTRLHERRVPIDFLTVSEELDQQNLLAEVGGPAYLTALINNVPTSLHAEAYGHLVEEASVRRRMIEAANQIAQLAYKEDTHIDSVMDEAEKAVFGVSERRTTRDLQTIQQVLSDYYDRIDQLARRGEEGYGVPTGFIDLDRMLTGMQASDFLIIAGRPGMGKCVAADTLIPDPDTGELHTVEELYRRKNAKLFTLNEHYKLEKGCASDFIDDGIKPLYRVRTALGREVKVTLSHPFLTMRGWEPLEKLSVGDSVAVPRCLPVEGKEDVPAYLVKTAAYLLADGNVTDTSPRFTNSDPRLRDDFSAAALEFPGVKTCTRDSGGKRTPCVYVVSDIELVKAGRKEFGLRLKKLLGDRGISRKVVADELGVSASLVTLWMAGKNAPSGQHFHKLCAYLKVDVNELAPAGLAAISWKGPNSMRLWLEEQGIWGKKAGEKDVPQVIFRAVRKKIALFLNRLFACDGSISIERGEQVKISYSTVSYRLAHSVQHLLLRFGIISRLRHRSIAYQGNRRPAFEIVITNHEDILRFLEQIGAYGKESAANKASNLLSQKGKNPNRDLIPVEVWDQILRAKGERTWRSVYATEPLSAHSNFHVGKRAISRERLSTFSRIFHSQELAELAQSDVYWDRITEIEYLGEHQVYDLTVPGTHNFVADDILVHNTAFMLSAAKNAAQVYKKHVAIFSLEMSNEQLVQRLISQETGIDSQRLRTGKLTDEEWPLFTHAIEVLSDTHIFLDDTPGLTPLQLRTKSRRLHLEYNLDLIILDYLQLMSSGSRNENRVQEVSYISRNMKILARELNVPVLAAAQLSRAIEQRQDKEPQLSDLRESGSLEQDADVVMFIHRPDAYEKDNLKQNIAQIKVAKHRNGPVGAVELVFRSNLAKFENAATRQVDLSRM